MAHLSPVEVKEVRRLAKKYFWFFVQSMMDPKWYDANYHKPLCDFLQYGSKDKLVVLPRSHLKTTIAGTMFPTWRAICEPGIRCLIASNSSPNAEKTVHAIRYLFESHFFIQSFFPEVIPKFNKVRWSDRCAVIARPEDYPEGTFESAGVGANIIRRHFNLIIEDDTVAPKKDEMSGDESMPSRDDIEKAIGFHKLTIPLLVTFKDDERVVIGTRWASYDLINYIKEKEVVEEGGRFEIFDRPAINEDGQPLYKRFSTEALEAIKISMGTYMFSSLYLNQPLAKEFMSFNPDWMRYYEEAPQDGHCLITVDPADPPTGKKDQSYSVALAGYHNKNGIYVLEYFRKRCSDRELINASIDLALKYGASKIRLETDRYAHMQYGFKDEIERRKSLLSPMEATKIPFCEGVKTRGKKKEARIMGLAPIAENGCLYLKKYMRELESEMFQFPHGISKDIVDALAWQLPDHYPGDYERKEETKVEKRYNKFSLEQILGSVTRGAHAPDYPFEVQAGMHNRVRELLEPVD